MTDPFLDRMRRSLERDMGRLLAFELTRSNAAAVYVVFATEAGLDGSRLNVRGLAGPWLSATYRDALAGRWQGHGPTILVNDVLLPAVFGAASHGLTGWAVHEFAHLVRTPGWMADFAATPANTNKAADLNAALIEPRFPTARASGNNLGGHDPQWVRATLHLATRLEAMGWSVKRSELGWPEWIGDPFALWATLAVELDDLRGMPLSDVLATPIPEGLLNRWQELRLPAG